LDNLGKDYLEIVMETVLDGLITIDKKGQIKSFNQSAVRIFGYQKEEVIGKNVKMLMPNPYQDEHDKYLTNYQETSHKKIIGIGREILAQRKNGEVFPMELGVNEMEVAGEVAYISERKASEKAIRLSLERMEIVMETVLDGLITIDKKGIIKSFNQSAVKIFGYQKEEVIDKNIKMLMPNPYQEEHDKYLTNYQETSDKKIIGIGREILAQRKNGDVFPMELGVNEMEVAGEVAFRTKSI